MSLETYIHGECCQGCYTFVINCFIIVFLYVLVYMLYIRCETVVWFSVREV